MQVPVVIDQNGCNGNADINFRFTGFVSCSNSTVQVFLLPGRIESLLSSLVFIYGVSYFSRILFVHRFTLSGRVVGAVGGESCLSKEGGPSNVKVELLSLTDDVISSVFTSSVGGYSFTNIIPGLECSSLHFNSSSSSNSYHLMK